MPFNQQQYNQALQAGYNDAQILDYLAQGNMGVNVEQLQQAREAGHVDQAIVNYLMGGAEQTSPQPSDPGFWNQLSGTFVDTVRQSNPELLGWAAEGLGTVSGLDDLNEWGGYLQKEFKDNPSEDFVPRIHTYKQVEDLESLLDYAGQGIGQAAGSFVVPIATGATGAAVGSLAGPGGTLIGGIGGAASGSFVLNYGETFKFLVEEEKVDRELAAKIAVVPGILMAGLDTLGLTKIVKPLASLTGKKIAKNIVKRAIQLGGRGYTIEAFTEAAQDIIKNITGEITEATGASPEDIQLAQRLESAINSFLIGGFGGGAISTVTSPFVSPTPEEKPQVLPDVTEGLPETLEEDSADAAEQTVTTAEIDPEADAAVVTEVATDEMETVAAEGLEVEAPPPTGDVVKAPPVEKVTDETVVLPVTVDTTGLPVEETEGMQDLDIPLTPDGTRDETIPSAVTVPDVSGFEELDPEFQPSSLETLPVVEDDTLIDVSTVTAINEAAETLVPKQETPPHILRKMRENLLRRLRAHGVGEDVPLAIVDTLSRQEMTGTLDAGPQEAKYIPRTKAAKGAIILALDAIPQSSLKKPKEMASYLAGLTDHETVHSWVDLGVINNNDMNALAKAASLAPHWSDPNKTVMEVIQETYGDLNETEQIEEAAAEMFRGHASGNVVLKGRPLSIWQRILNFFRNLKGGLAEADIYKAAQVFERIQTSPDFVAATAAAPAEDFGEELVTSLEAEKEDKAARTFHGGAVMWKPEVGRALGTPDLSFVGEGEGITAFGWGFYSGQALGTGKQYRIDQGHNNYQAILSLLPEYFTPGRIINGYSGRDKVLGFNRYDETTGQDWSVDVIAVDRKGNPKPGVKPRRHSTLPDPKEIERVLEKPIGVMYELDVPDDAVAKFLDWDAPLRDQPEIIEKLVRSTGLAAEELISLVPSKERLSRYELDGLPRNAKIGYLLNYLNKDPHGGVRSSIATGQTLMTIFGKTKDTSELFRDADIPGLQFWDQLSRGSITRKLRGGTRNFVIWDQDVLNRSEIRGINEIPVNQIAVNLSAATKGIQGLQDLQDAANTGDIEAQQVLQDVASDSLAYLLSGIPDVRILSTPAQGLYFGGLEPSIGLDVGFAEENKRDALAALAKFADNFNQEQIHVRTTPDPDTDVSFVYPDGSFNTASVKFNLKEPMSREEVEKIITSSGLAGMTVTDTYLDAYYLGDPSDTSAIQEFRQAAGRAAQSLEGRTSGIDAGVQRLWAYGEGYGATNPYSDIRGPLRPPDAEEGNRTSWRVAQRLRGRPFIPVPPQQSLTPEQRDLQSDIADAFDEMPVNDLGNPQVRKAYDELARELKSQFRALPIKVETVVRDEDAPSSIAIDDVYSSSDAMRKDILDNNRLRFLATNAAAFGPQGVAYDNHPLLQDSGFTDVTGRPLLINDIFRAVHDYYAHTMEPNKFGPLGEEAAWQNHMRMTRSPWARWALTSETRGQNSWQNFHNLGIVPAKRADTLPITERGYAEQKTALLPIQYTMTGDPVLDQEMVEVSQEGVEKSARSFVLEDAATAVLNERRKLEDRGAEEWRRIREIVGEAYPNQPFLTYAEEHAGEGFETKQGSEVEEYMKRINILRQAGKDYSDAFVEVDQWNSPEFHVARMGKLEGLILEEPHMYSEEVGVEDIVDLSPAFKELRAELDQSHPVDPAGLENAEAELDSAIEKYAPPISDVEILGEQLSAATSTDKEARRFTDLPPAARKLVVAGYDTAGKPTAKFGTIRHQGKDVPVMLPVGTPQDRGLLHVLSNEDHMDDFRHYTPYGWGPIRNERTTVKRALESLLKAYWNPELQAPRKGYAVADVTTESARNRHVALEWRDPASKHPIRAAFHLLDPADVTGLKDPMFIMDTIFPVTGKENPAYQEARKELKKDGRAQLDNLSPAGRDAAIMAWKERIKKDKLSRPISQEWSIKTKPTDMGVDIPSGIVAVQQHETLGEKFLTKLGMLGGTPLDSFGEFFTWFRRAHVDEWDPARRGDVALSEKDERYSNFLSASSSAWSGLRSARRGTAITAYALSKGVPVYKNGGTSVKDIPEDAQQTNIDGTTERSRIAGTSTGFIPIIEPLRKGNRFDPFQLYSIARRAARLIREGRERLLTQDQIAQYLAMGNTTAEIAQIMQLSEAEVNTLLGGRTIKYNDDFSNIFQDYQVWNGYFVDFLVDTGVLTREKADIWKETADYIPFYRQLDVTKDAIPGDPDLFNGMVAAAPPPPLNGQGNVWAVIATDANKVSTSLPTTFRGNEKKQADAYAEKFKQETGMDVKVVNRGMPIGGFLETITENALSAIQTGMMNVGVQRVMRNMVLIDPIQTVKAKHRTHGSVTFRVKGEALTLMVPDKALYSSLSNYLQNQSIPAWVNLLGMPARFLREMITRSPDFMAANMLRDSLSAWVTSGRKTGALAGTIGGFSQALRGSTSAEALASAGLMTGFDFGGDPTKMTQFIEKELLKYKYPSAAGRFMRNPLKGIWDATGKASRSSDAATRIAVYERVLKDTGDEVQAFWEAQEVINFSARGSSPLIQNLAVMIPFLNARIQGLDVLYRSSMGRKGFAARPESDIVRRQFYMKALLVGMSSAAYWALVHDDEEYINQNPEIKDNYWIIPASWIPFYDGPPLKIPIPFEVGFLFKTIPERVMALYFGKDVPRDITRSVRQGLYNTFEFLPIPQAVLPVIEVATNHSFWTGRKIEGNALEDEGMPGYRANSRTSSLAIKLGEEFNYSPVKIDHMIRGYGGTLGTVLLDTVDGVIRDVASDLGERPAKQLSEYPFVKRFIARPDARGLVTQFYDLRRAVTEAVDTANSLEKGELTFPKSEEFKEEYAHLLVLEDEVKVISGVLNELRSQREEIMAQDISAEAKRELIDEITAMELMAVESVPDLRQEAFQ